MQWYKFQYVNTWPQLHERDWSSQINLDIREVIRPEDIPYKMYKLYMSIISQ